MAYCGRENTDAFSLQDNMSINEEPETLQNFQLSSGFVLNTEVSQEKMEVDLGLPPAHATVNASLLRRSSSIPLINGFGDNSQGSQVDTLRMRRNSSSFLNHHPLMFLPSRTRISGSRIFQIKQEEGTDIASREVMHEREMHTIMQISQSWEENFNLNDNNDTEPFTVKNIKLLPVTQMASVTKKPGKNH